MLCRTLLLDDDSSVLAALRRELMRKPDIGHDGLEIESFTSPHAALARALTPDGYFDLAIVDYRMPDVDGISFLAELKKLQPDCVRILLTAYADCDNAIAAINTAHVDCLVFKPWHEYDLKGHIALALHQRQLLRKAPATRQKFAAGPYQLMLVDDEEALLHALEREIRVGGAATDGTRPLFQIRSHSSAEAALGSAAAACPDLVIADYSMPGMDGITFLHRLRDVCPNAVRIMLTAHRDLSLLIDAINIAGVFHYVNKPWAPAELRSTLSQALIYRDILIESNATQAR